MTATSESQLAIETFLAEHKSLRAMPESTFQIIKLTRDPNCDIRQLLKLIERDAALSARIIKSVNSAFYSLQTQITRLDRAVAFMGLKAVKEVTVASSLASICNGPDLGRYSARDLWDHCVAVAIVARELAIRTRLLNPEDAFLFGMLHDIGLLMAAQGEPETCEELFAQAETRRHGFLELEEQQLGFSHSELGEALAVQWKFPSDLAGVIRHHHAPLQAPEPHQVAAAHVFLADNLCVKAGIGFCLTCTTQTLEEQDLIDVGLAWSDADEICMKLPVLMRLHHG